MAVTMKNAVKPCGSDVSEERIASVIIMERISELGATLAVSSNYFFAAGFSR
jgi:hypothetical protein